MSAPSSERGLRALRGLNPEDLTEQVTLKHSTTTASTSGPAGEKRTLAWESTVWAWVQDRVGSLGETGAVEDVPVDAVIGIRDTGEAGKDPNDLTARDEVIWLDKPFFVERVERGWADGLLVYLRSK